MTPSKLQTPQSFVARLETQRKKFTEEKVLLLPSQRDALSRADDVAKDDPNFVKRYTNRKRSAMILKEIKNRSSELYLLFALTAWPTELGKLATFFEDYLPEIEQWWNNVKHPAGLSFACEAHSQVEDPNTSISKQGNLSPPNNGDNLIPELETVSRSKKRPRLSESRCAVTPIEHLSHIEPASENSLSGFSLDRSNQAAQRITKLEFGDIFSFIGGYNGGCGLLEIRTSPGSPDVLPSIPLFLGSSEEPAAMITMKRHLCRELVTHVIHNGKSRLEFNPL